MIKPDQWNKLTANGLRNITAGFALGTISGREFCREAQFHNVGGSARQLIDTYGVTYGRRVARKALRRRGVINSLNLVK